MNGSRDAGLIAVEVAYALPEKQKVVQLEVSPGTTALQAARLSGIADDFSGLRLDEASRLGIFGHIVAPDQELQAGDRVEIYRPLLVDPKEVRKQRAARARDRREET
jgi:putative ubiquitin-RnfH superfamily antitoxin RatB of RatAB toxin-antitoxin module